MSVFERMSSDESGASSRASPANYNAHDEDDVAPLIPCIPIVRIGSSDARHTVMTPVVNVVGTHTHTHMKARSRSMNTNSFLKATEEGDLDRYSRGLDYSHDHPSK